MASAARVMTGALMVERVCMTKHCGLKCCETGSRVKYSVIGLDGQYFATEA